MPSKQHPSLFPNVQAFGLQAHVFFEQCLDFLRMLVQDVIEDVGGNHVHTHSRCDGYLLQLAVGFVRDADNFPVLHLVVNQVVGELLLPYPFFSSSFSFFPLWALQEPFPLQDPFRSSRSLPAPAFLPRTFLLPFLHRFLRCGCSVLGHVVDALDFLFLSLCALLQELLHCV